jgi:hypothetical protein
MALTGQLNDLSLSELIEFFCNQRKTGRLKVDYALAPGVFFIKEGELVDAKIGSLDGAEAIYFSLTLPSAAFDFSAGIQSSRRTINEPWTRVVLEGLRRIDEGIPPSEQDPFAGLRNEELDSAISQYLYTVEAAEAKSAPEEKPVATEPEAAGAPDSLPLSMMVETTGAEAKGGRKFLVAGVAAAVLLACVVAGVPLARRLNRSSANAPTPAPVAAQPAPADTNSTNSTTPAPETVASPTDAAAEDAVLAARRDARERELRLQREREQRKQEEAKKAAEQQQALTPAPTPAPVGPKTVRVSISYDESGHVTSASAVGFSAGAEAYASTAVRIARGRRFPAGQAGSTVVTIPIN